MREEWLRAPDLPAQQAVAARIQEQAFSDVPYLPLGEYSIPTATRKEVSGVLKGLPLFWGGRKAEWTGVTLSGRRSRLDN